MFRTNFITRQSIQKLKKNKYIVVCRNKFQSVIFNIINLCAFNKCWHFLGTKFGAILDQLTDRAGTACLMMTLATFYPQHTFWFQISMAIDITCHWLYLHTVTLQGKASHKFIDMSENPIMRIYYTNKMVLFAMCAGNEAFYAALYVMYFYTGPTGMYYISFRLIKITVRLFNGHNQSCHICILKTETLFSFCVIYKIKTSKGRNHFKYKFFI